MVKAVATEGSRSRPSRQTAKRLHLTSDENLLRDARTGDSDAYGEIWRRHSKAALVAARSFRDLAEPEDVVAEAFATILETLRNGGGPRATFRPYLYVTIRNLAHRRLRLPPTLPLGDEADGIALDGADDPVEGALDRSVTARAFRALPERWQNVLWYTEVEQLSARQTGELMGIGANAVAALAFRARAALREAWLQGHVSEAAQTGSHREVLAKVGGWSLGTLSQRDEAMVDAHLKTCTRCRVIAEEVDDLSGRLGLVLLPLVLGGAAALAFSRHLASGAQVSAVSAASVRLTAVVHPAHRWPLVLASSVTAAAVITVAVVALSPPGPVATAGSTTQTVGGGSGRGSAPLAAPTASASIPAAPSATATPPIAVVVPGPSPRASPARRPVPTSTPAPAPSPSATATPTPSAPTTPSAPPTPAAPTVDTTPPAPPTVLTTWVAAQLLPLQLNGTAEPLATITVELADGTVLATVSAGPTGLWATGVVTGLTPILPGVLVTATDAAGNVSAATTVGPFAFVPSFTDADGQSYPPSAVPVHLSGWPGTSVDVRLNGTDQGVFVFGADGTLTLSAQTVGGGALPAGEYTVTATYVVGAARAPSSTSLGFTVAVAP
ncbi:sigma-70 family RNA polymerase sigma factor [Frondihabitans cladoniiphilus]|uniref:RNA polymerase sigma factor (Sigma-70 family) n=1 Tax=Frondihabitans cladoniiphilus TaxID=715785 RepID=A0ABP8VT03_9MICO